MAERRHNRVKILDAGRWFRALRQFVAGYFAGPGMRHILLATSAIAILALVLVGFLVWRGKAIDNEPWFAGYVDVTVSPAYAFQSRASGTTKNVVLSFIVADPANPCVPHWGTEYNLDEAGTSLGLDANLAQFRKRGGHAAVSFGGSKNTELAVSCTDVPSLQDAYWTVMDRYEVSTLDFDIEGDGLADTAAAVRRAEAVEHVQTKRHAEGKTLNVWLTLPVSPHGLTDDGVAQVEAMLRAGVDLAGVNLMTMNYGDSRPPGLSMLEASEDAAVAAHSQLGIIYQRAGQDLDSQSVWTKIGLTPMIGTNEIATDVFDLESASQFAKFAEAKKVGRMSMWSYNRDTECLAGGPEPASASHVCSGVPQEDGAFTEALGPAFKGTFR